MTSIPPLFQVVALDAPGPFWNRLELVETAVKRDSDAESHDASLEEVAATVEDARSTASTVLRRAESSLMRALVGQ